MGDGYRPQDGDEVLIVWDGGNGPWKYIVFGESAFMRAEDRSLFHVAHLSWARIIEPVYGPRPRRR